MERQATNGNLYDIAVKTKTNPGAYRLARYEFCGVCCWSDSFNPGQIFLQPAGPACVGATTFAFRASLEPAVRLDGYRRMAGLALRRISQQSHRALAVFATTRIQRHMELALLCLAPRRVGLCRHRVSVGAYCDHPGLFLARAPSCWRSPHSILAMDQFRICPQLLPVAAQSPGSGLVMCCLTRVCSRWRQGCTVQGRRYTSIPAMACT